MHYWWNSSLLLDSQGLLQCELKLLLDREGLLHCVLKLLFDDQGLLWCWLKLLDGKSLLWWWLKLLLDDKFLLFLCWCGTIQNTANFHMFLRDTLIFAKHLHWPVFFRHVALKHFSDTVWWHLTAVWLLQPFLHMLASIFCSIETQWY